MKWISFFALTGVLISSRVFAVDPVTLSEPVPSIAQTYATGTPQTVVYTVTNQVPKNLPITVSGISGPITRTPVTNDCENTLPVGPASCNIGIQIELNTAGSSINQTLQINSQGRAPLTSPISFSVVQPFAYVTPGPNADTLLYFVLDATSGVFSSMETAYSSVSQNFDELTFATVGGVQYAYVLDQNGFVYQCTIDVDGTFDTCSGTPQSPLGWAPRGIAFATVSGVQYAYITDAGSGEVYQCSLNLDGSFNSCLTVVDFSFNAPYGIAFATIGGTQYAYIAEAVSNDSSYGSVYRCTLNGDGSFNTCTSTPQLNTPDWIPYTVTFATSGGTQYAYVADNGTTPTNGNVYQCTLTNDGFFDTCSPTPSSDAPTTNWAPSSIAFATLEGTQYAYVGNYQGPTEGGMYLCNLSNNNDGTFSACNPTPVTTPPIDDWQPIGIAFRFN